MTNSWDDDDDVPAQPVNWDDDDHGPDQPGHNPIKPSTDLPYTDSTIMPFGKYEGRMLSKVPAYYLIWLFDNGKNLNPKLKAYIKDNLDSLNQEIKTRK